MIDAEPRLTFRASERDRENLTKITTSLHAKGQHFVTRTDAIRSALEVAAAHISRSPADLAGEPA